MIVKKTSLTEIAVPLTVFRATTFQQRLRGLMFRKQPLRHEALFIAPCNSIHMFFMFFAIDVIFLDRNHYVVTTVPALQPWRMIPPVKHAYSTLECPVNTIQTYTIERGDQIMFTF